MANATTLFGNASDANMIHCWLQHKLLGNTVRRGQLNSTWTSCVLNSLNVELSNTHEILEEKNYVAEKIFCKK